MKTGKYHNVDFFYLYVAFDQLFTALKRCVISIHNDLYHFLLLCLSFMSLSIFSIFDEINIDSL